MIWHDHYDLTNRMEFRKSRSDKSRYLTLEIAMESAVQAACCWAQTTAKSKSETRDIVEIATEMLCARCAAIPAIPLLACHVFHSTQWTGHVCGLQLFVTV